MARPVKKRRVCGLPATSEFAPCVRRQFESVEMTIDEYEVIRLIDHLDLTQSECAKQMNVARTTVQAIYDSARSKIADTIVNGKKLVIQGGNYVLCSDAPACCVKNCTRQRGIKGHCDKQSGESISCANQTLKNPGNPCD
ncbi:DUF134 domain-containing protein [Clostridium sp. E02]|uniref:DUF134 domain-containing protein n=1 Tax=Clostridium sp. E02 TaxID=2487134 RepID=UPI000F5334E7|nr:DUF134 domain-containing protein [Clostridium sp. E02]